MADKNVNGLVEELSTPKVRRVRGSSPEYTERINKQYEDALPLLREKGYPVDKWDMKGIESQLRDFFKGSESDQELQGHYAKHNYDAGNKLWDERYKPTFDALMIALDKYYNDDWQKKAPMGYEDD